MSENYRLGPCWIFTASNVTDPFDQWTSLGFTQGNVVATIVGGKVILNRVDQLGNIPYAGATFKFGDTFEFSFPLVDKQINTLIKTMPGSVKLTAASKDAFALTPGVKGITGSAFALVPVDEYEEGSPWWKSEHTLWMFRGIANPSGEIENYSRVQEDDLKPYEVTVMHVDDENGRGGIGCLWQFGIDVIGFNDAASMSFAVTDTDTEDALNTAGHTTIRDLVDITGALDISANTPLLTDLSGVEYAFNASGIDVSGNDVSQGNMSAFIHELWLNRVILGGNACVIDISGNNGVNAQATAEIADLVAEGCTVTT